MADKSLYEKPILLDPLFPIRISYEQFENAGFLFSNHWHEQIELLYFTSGTASIQFNAVSYTAQPGDLLIANSNELHFGKALTDDVEYYCIIADTSILQSSFIDTCDSGRINRNANYCTLLMNKVSNDRYIRKCMHIIEEEQKRQEPGYELAVKSAVLRLIAILIRKYANKLLTPQKYGTRLRNLEKLNKVLEYIEEMYNENITVEKACRIVNLSPYYFCRLFKDSTGRTFTEYVNHIRMNKAELLLKNTDMNISEVALNTGFNDANYFSRLFKKLNHVSPSCIKEIK